MVKEYTKRRNLNRGYMKLEVWNNGIELFKYCFNLLNKIPNLDFKLKSQILNSSQSITSNIAEGYCRRSINEYLQFLNISLGSSGELLTRIVGLKEIALVGENDFEQFDQKHYEVENKLLSLVKSLQVKQNDGTWDNKVHEPNTNYDTP